MTDEKAVVKKRKFEENAEQEGGGGEDKLAKLEQEEASKKQALDGSENSNLNDQEEAEEEEDSMGGDDEDVDDEEDSDQEFINKEIEVEFAAFDATKDDFHGIKCLLKSLWLKESIDLSQMAELIIHHDTIASVLKQEEEDEDSSEPEQSTSSKANDDEDEEKHDVYGVISLIPLNDASVAKNVSLQQVKQLLLSYIPTTNGIHNALSNSSCALVINERFLNLPPKISTPCYTELISELNEKVSKEQQEGDYRFDFIIMVCKILKNKGEVKANVGEQDQVIYVNAEDELFSEAATTAFEYSVSSQCDSDVFDWNDDEHLYEPYRKILLLSKDKWLETVDRLKEYV